MKKPRGSKLAASFVVTVSALPAAGMLEGCKKQPLHDPDPDTNTPATAYIHRNGAKCFMGVSMPCPKNVSCNPPPPMEIDCPPSHRDAGEPDPSPARPPGKEGFIRVRPHLYASQYGCSIGGEHFCTAPPAPHRCDPPGEAQTLKCGRVLADGGVTDAGNADGGAVPPKWRIEAFVYKDALGVCRQVPSFECGSGDCIDQIADAKTVPCP